MFAHLPSKTLVFIGITLAFCAVALFVLSLGSAGALAAPNATDWYVATGGLDTNLCTSWGAACQTIQGAYNKAAASGDTIHVAAGQYYEKFTLNKDLTIIGTHPNRGLVTIINGSIPGSVMSIGSGHALTLTGATIRNSQPVSYGGGLAVNGRLVGNDLFFTQINATQYGAALYVNPGGIAILDDITISANTVYTSGGGIYNSGALTITNSTIKNNQVLATDGSGGGIVNYGSLVLSNVSILTNTVSHSAGGLLNNNGATAHLQRVDISGNHAGDSGGIFNGGTLELTDVTIQENVSASAGGALVNWHADAQLTNVTIYSNTAQTTGGAGIYNYQGALTLINVTISGNTSAAGVGAAIRNLPGTVSIINSTIVDNHVLSGGGAGGVYSDGSAIDFQLDNSILAYNDNDNCGGVIGSSSGRNIDDDEGVCFSDDDLWVDPLLSPLADNGGFTQTHLPQPGSYAIDNGSDDANVCYATDQRGWQRPIDGDGNGIATCDIGSLELTIPVFLPVVQR
jgi:hypothetical protein